MWFRNLSKIQTVWAFHLWISIFWDPPTLFSSHDFLTSLFWFTGFIFLVSQAREPGGFSQIHLLQCGLHRLHWATGRRPQRWELTCVAPCVTFPQQMRTPHTSLSASHSPVLFVSCTGYTVVSWGVVVGVMFESIMPGAESSFFKKTFCWDFVIQKGTECWKDWREQLPSHIPQIIEERLGDDQRERGPPEPSGMRSLMRGGGEGERERQNRDCSCDIRMNMSRVLLTKKETTGTVWRCFLGVGKNISNTVCVCKKGKVW